MKQTKKIIAALAAATMVASCAGVVADVDNLAYYVARRGAGYKTDLNRYGFRYGEYESLTANTNLF